MNRVIFKSLAAATICLLSAHPFPVNATGITAQDTSTQRQVYRITGKVTDSSGEDLPGATILVKGTRIGTSTDVEGNFELNIPKKGKVTLVVTYVGMKTKELGTTTGSNVNIILEESTDMLDEVVVSGFQTISRERNTGSAVVINTEKLAKVQAPDLTSKLEGITPGLTIYNNEMSIRGNSSFSISSTPLLVIDGQPATGMSLGDINPNTIESVTVLKDAAATSLYGVYASNGVIVVTTKKGGEGKIEANFSLGYYLNPLPSLDYQHYASTSDIIDLEQEMLLNNPDYIKSPAAYFSTKNNKTNAAYLSQVDMLYYRLMRNEINGDQLNASLDALRRNDYRKEYRKQLQKNSLTQDYVVNLG